MSTPYKEYRCKKCAKLFFRGLLVDGEIEVKCRGCHEINTLVEDHAPEFMCMVSPCPYRVHMGEK
jgi:phage FluMu protein Com